MIEKKNVVIICGGQSPEHEVTLRSARYIAQNMPCEFTYCILGIDRENQSYLLTLDHLRQHHHIHKGMGAPEVSFIRSQGRVQLVTSEPMQEVTVDIAFPIIHGVTGEDGALQGFLKFLGLPCVGADVVGSALCMHKRFTKQVLMANGLPIVPFLWMQDTDKPLTYPEVQAQLGEIIFIKPVNSGSSAGVSKVSNAQEYEAALQCAFQYDHEILLERAIVAKEIECAILNGRAASVLGEITPKPHHDFYSYEAKYLDPDGANIYVPARIAEADIQRVRVMAEKAARVLACASMVRVDFFLEADGTLWVNELNTLPGFTAISLYPQLWEASRVSGTELVRTLLLQAEVQYAHFARSVIACPVG
jgi:D-alanine-D-alanine ligase